ncbi:MAG TPA: hypothetical protein VG755_10635 [Nannocystaceae bacterium]|nr:hypothetical protein [Nannocystaceae bacterium]
MTPLVIRQAQLDALAEARERELEDRLIDRLADPFDRQSALLKREGMRAVVKLGIERASAWGVVSERDLFVWIAMMLMLGASFDEDPQLPWAQAELTAPGVGASQRVARTYAATLAHLDRICGDENERLVRAIVRLRDLELARFEGLVGAALVDAMMPALAHAYPEKAEAQGRVGTHEALVAAVATAAAHDLSGGIGAALCCGLAFMVGSGFATDPQVPWVARTLALDVDEPEKTAKLKREVDRFIAFGLSDG